ncbi:hypothetical protein FPQ18DRAFT_307143 [Pyronema domesticum]|nr:hypothetical protein FPQ18DRAFT_307143 [Pyronema domesticum]
MSPSPPPPHPSRSVIEHAAKPKKGKKKDLDGVRAGRFGGYYSSVDLTATSSQLTEAPDRLENPFVSQDDLNPAAIATQALWEETKRNSQPPETHSGNFSESTAPAPSIKHASTLPLNTSGSSAHLNPDRKNKSRSTSLGHRRNAKFKKLTELLIGGKLGTEEKRQRPVQKSQQQAKQKARDEGIDGMESMALLERSRGEYMGGSPPTMALGHRSRCGAQSAKTTYGWGLYATPQTVQILKCGSIVADHHKRVPASEKLH